MSIQGSINSMIGSIGSAVFMAKHNIQSYRQQQEKAAKVATKQPAASQQMTRQQANAIMEQERQNQVDQKQEFQNYISNLETNFGGKVSDLPEAMQKQIYEQLSKEKK